MNAISLYFVRHGQSFANLDDRFFEDSRSELTELGKQQAKQAGEELKSLGVEFDAVYSSPYMRAIQTCQIAMATAGIEDSVSIDMSLKERDFSGLYGRMISREHYKKLWDYDSNQSEIDGIEDLRDMEARAFDFLNYLRHVHSGGRVLVFSHGGFGLAVRAVLMGRPENGSLFSWPLMKNGQIAIFGY